jgi:hypothetical protein
VADMADADLSRSGIAASIGLHGAVGFPVRNGREFLGVMEFLGRQTNTPDDHVVQMMGCIGGQISQFIERRQAERVLEQQNQDRRTATSIQQALLPSAMPALAGFEIGAKAAFAQDVGGDCFDFVPRPWNARSAWRSSSPTPADMAWLLPCLSGRLVPTFERWP